MARFARLILLKYLSNKLANLFFCTLKGLPSRCRRSIKAPRLPALPFYRRPQISPAFQTVEDRIESTGTWLVAVSAKLIDDPMTEDRGLGSVVENVQPDHPGIKIFVAHFRTPSCHYRFSTTKGDTTTSSSGRSTRRLP